MSTPSPAAFDFLHNREVIQIAIGVYQVIFAFDQSVTVSVESQFNYTSGSTTVDWAPGNIRAAAKTVELLGCTVLRAEQNDQSDLRLFFSNGDLLTITRATNGFESYQVTGKGTTIVV